MERRYQNMKWFIILLMLVSPVIAVAEDEGAPPVAEPAVAEPAVAEAPAAEAQDGQGAGEPGRAAEPAKPGEAGGKGGTPRSDKDDPSSVRFQSIDDLNKLGR
jgi:hypothetical protein